MKDAAGFIRDNTRLIAPSYVPELRLWLADELMPLWHATEDWLAQQNCAPPYWAFAWAGGQALARYILDHPETAAGRRIFDLASGGGVSPIAAAKAGALTVIANEIDPLALAAIELNATANDVGLSLCAGDQTGQALPEVDIVLAGDICYERDMADRLLPWLRSLVAQGTEVWLSDPGRAYLPKDGLEPLATYIIPVTFDLESATSRKTTLYRLQA